MEAEPLSTRVPRGGLVERPSDTDGVTWRPMLAGDEAELDRIVELSDAIGHADHPNYLDTREEIAEELAHSWVDLARDSVVAVDDASGRFLAHGLVVEPPGQETMVREILVGGVHPGARGRGLGRHLLAWQEARGLERLSASSKALPGWLMVHADERAPAAARLAAHAGFTATRYFLGVVRDIADPIPELVAPPGIRIVPFDPTLSASTLAAYQASFVDHWGSQPATAEQWESMIGLPQFRPDLSRLAVTEDDVVVGFLITYVTESDFALDGFSSGYIGLVGVVRDWRRRGIAPALLADTFRAYRSAGLEKAVLDVDSDNPSGALGLYTGMGFIQTTRSVAYLKVY